MTRPLFCRRYIRQHATIRVVSLISCWNIIYATISIVLLATSQWSTVIAVNDNSHHNIVTTTTNNNNKPQQQQDQRHEPKRATGSCSPMGYLLAANDHNFAHNQHQLQPALNQTDALIRDLLKRRGADMRPTGAFRDFEGVSVGVAQRAWALMHERARSFAGSKLEQSWPAVELVLGQANVSSECMRAAEATLLGARQFESWAIQLLNAWGSFPPSGLFEGTYGDIGSYAGCLNVPENPHIGHAHYCTLAYRPILPTRRSYELVVTHEPDELLQMFDQPTSSRTIKDAFGELLKHAQYNHYVYYKLGTCFPIACSPRDVQRIALSLGERSILLSGPVKCSSKHPKDYQDAASKSLQLSSKDLNGGVYIWKPHFTGAQRVSLIAVGLLTGLIVALTLCDCLLNRWSKLYGSFASKNNNNENTQQDESLSETTKNQLDPNNNTDLNGNNNNIVFLQLEQPTKLLAPAQEPEISNIITQQQLVSNKKRSQQKSSFMRQIIHDCSIVTNTLEYFHVDENKDTQLKNDILCINGIRCLTMSWIIVAHTMQYNDWSAFARTREVETHLKSLITQPLFNATYLVDTFFLISGLLTSYSSFSMSKSAVNLATSTTTMKQRHNNNERQLDAILARRFSWRRYLIGRYLRLTPQILLVSLLFILLPLLGEPLGGPHWYTMTGEYSENCSANWWINLFHIQAFYKSDQMCNFVCWWISVDMFYHLLALMAILLALSYGRRAFLWACLVPGLCAGLIQFGRHYQLQLPPNLLSTIPQTGAMWSTMTLAHFWTPYAHALPFALGLYAGHRLARKRASIRCWLTARKALAGWSLSILALLTVAYSTQPWVVGAAHWSPAEAALFGLLSPLVWSASWLWVIVACESGRGAGFGRLLSCRLFIVLGRASYIVYLSHFLVLFTFFGSQNLLLEPSRLIMAYVILGNIILSMVLGSMLCIIYEMPYLKLQRRLMRHIR